ncbi:MAG: hypothetical protein A3C62_00755 [Candidatus Zambryskibacteria bacterium RIFCSPHIGHO2_02_FULL_39_16]|nr:MAG: hypothetical protein A3C62_00755 [Candidatus Zambryskibacteria bacterium RIFCSPHIGHO2_02_FULL_39_16]
MKFSFSVKDQDFVKADASWGFVQNCVSVARKPEGVALRDTKDESKNTLFFTNDEWKAFIDGVKNDEFGV